MGFKEDTRETLADLDIRVSSLEDLAVTLRRTGLTPAPDRATVARNHPAQVTPTGTVVDARAIAFGLSEVKREVSSVIREGVDRDEVARTYKGIVQYFSDVLAKADPAFDADLFARQAGA